jgi:hypothetical protein
MVPRPNGGTQMRPDLLDWMFALAALDIVALFVGVLAFLISRATEEFDR